jgi:hypothetical protein
METAMTTLALRPLSAALLVLAAALAGATPTRADTGPPAPDHAAFDRLLGEYVVGGRVRYAAWKAKEEDVRALSAYVDALEAADPARLGRDDALAYWIDLYNAATLELVLAHYPLESIKDIGSLGGLVGSPWKREVVRVAGEPLTLDAIENEVIRPRFGDPRVHFALNCAAASCPPLQPFAFAGARLEEQLETATREFLQGAGARVDADGRLHVSKILDWYKSDFGGSDAAVAAFVARRAASPGLTAAVERGGPVDVLYQDYDWSLNDAGGRPD